VEQVRTGMDALPFRFTGKTLDEDTGLYYFGARHLNPQKSMWLSVDSAMGEYVPGVPVNDDVRKQNGNLPGMGGVFYLVNLHLYHYAGNNPVRLKDPTGRDTKDTNENIFNYLATPGVKEHIQKVLFFGSLQTQVSLSNGGYDLARSQNACVVLTLMSAVQDFSGKSLTNAQVTSLIDQFYNNGLIDSSNDVQGIPARNKILNMTLDAVYNGESPYRGTYEDGLQAGANYTERRGKTISPPFSGGNHSQLGDRNGNFLFDPWNGVGNRNKADTVKVRGSIFFTENGE
jgi:RHS repeat-associated protein